MSTSSKRPEKKGTAAQRTYSSPERSQDHSTRERIQSVDAGASPEELGRLLEGYGFALSFAELNHLARFHALLVERNKTQNLTRIWSLEDMVLKHYVDCLLVARLMPDLPSPLLDLGTGAGFPGIVLKIVNPNLHVVLAESVGKKVRFLQEAVEMLGLPGLEVFGRSVTSDFDRPVKAVITRAVEPMAETLKRCQNCLRPGSLAIFMKGPSVDEEKPGLGLLRASFEEIADHHYTLPGGEFSRRLLVYRCLQVGRADVERRSAHSRKAPLRP